MDFRSSGPVVAPSPAVPSLAEPPCALYSRSNCDGSRDVPSGYPAVLRGKSTWTGTDFNDETDFIYHLNEAELKEICAAKDFFNSLELNAEDVNRDTFPLPTLGPKLDQLSQEIYGGRGFCVIRGIEPEKYTVEDLTAMWLGVQSYIADQRGRQDDRGNMLVHIIADKSTEAKEGHHRHSTSAISFHNEESGDVISWLTRSTATTGGRCIIAPVHTIYNILAAQRPDMIRTLAKSDWPVALPHFQCRPLIFYHESKLMMNFGRTPLLGNEVHPRPNNLPSVNERQRKALDKVEEIAKAVQLDIQTQAGDMHFINNFTVLHRREEFSDGEGPQEKRHLVRMRLRSSQLGWAIPDDLKHEWACAFEDKGNTAWHVQPMPGDAFPLRKYTN